MNDNLYEVEPVKTKVEHKKPVIVGFFILQYAKLHMLEFYYNFSKILWLQFIRGNGNGHKFALLSGSTWCSRGFIEAELKETWNTMRRIDCSNELLANSASNFFHGTFYESHIKHDKRESGLFRKNFVALKRFICAIKLSAASIRPQKK